jgi:protein-serine/threonine kinase
MSYFNSRSPQLRQPPLPSSSPGRTTGRLPLRTSHSAPPSLGIINMKGLEKLDQHNAVKRSMESQSEEEEEDEDRIIAIQPTLLTRASSVGNSYGVTGIGRGFDWTWEDDSDGASDSEVNGKDAVEEIRDESDHPTPPANDQHTLPAEGKSNLVVIPPTPEPPRVPSRSASMFASKLSQMATLGLNLNGTTNGTSPPQPSHLPLPQRTFSYSGTSTPPEYSPFHSPRVRSPNLSPSSSSQHLPGSPHIASSRINSPRVTRSRSNQSRRVSVISGRQVPVRMPSPPPDLVPRLSRFNSTSSFLSIASTAATAPPSPGAGGHPCYLGGRSIENFMVLGEAGRGAYGMVKRAREFKVDGSLGVSTTFYMSLASLLNIPLAQRHH